MEGCTRRNVTLTITRSTSTGKANSPGDVSDVVAVSIWRPVLPIYLVDDVFAVTLVFAWGLGDCDAFAVTLSPPLLL